MISRDLYPTIKYDDEVRCILSKKKNHRSRFARFVFLLIFSAFPQEVAVVDENIAGELKVTRNYRNIDRKQKQTANS